MAVVGSGAGARVLMTLKGYMLVLVLLRIILSFVSMTFIANAFH